NEPKIERQLIFEPGASQQPEGIVAEDGLADRPQPPPGEIVVAAERVHAFAAARALRDGIDAEIAGREVVLDRSVQRREIDRAPVGERHPPGAVALRERERRASGRAGVAPSRALRL